MLKFFVFVILCSCTNPKSKDNASASIDTTGEISVNQYIDSLINSSSFSSVLQDSGRYNTLLDHVKENDVLLIKIYQKTDINDYGIVGWIEIDLNNEEVRDVTYDIDNPKILDYENRYLRKIQSYYGIGINESFMGLKDFIVCLPNNDLPVKYTYEFDAYYQGYRLPDSLYKYMNESKYLGNIYMYKLPSESYQYRLIMSGISDIGQKEMHLIICDSLFNKIAKKIIYSFKEFDSVEDTESTVFEISSENELILYDIRKRKNNIDSLKCVYMLAGKKGIIRLE